MLSNPVSAYSHQLSNISSDASSVSLEDSFFCEDDAEDVGTSEVPTAGPSGLGTTKDSNSAEPASGLAMKSKKELFRGSNEVVSLAKTFSNNVLADPNTCPTNGCDASRLEASALESNEHGTHLHFEDFYLF